MERRIYSSTPPRTSGVTLIHMGLKDDAEGAEWRFTFFLMRILRAIPKPILSVIDWLR
jgi:hypothetical protein